jgi:hypothetical protein
MCRTFFVLIALGSAFGCSAADAPSSVSIQLLSNLPVVTAKIDGHDVPLVFDLGDASALVLAERVIDRVKTFPTGETNRSTDVQGNVIESPKFKLARLQIGNAVFTDVIGRRDLHDPKYHPPDVGQQGYFGTSLLKSYMVVLDYRHRQMTFIPAGSSKNQSAKCSGTAVPFLPEWNGYAVTKVSTDLGELTAIWDTGSDESVLRKAGSQKISNSDLTETVITKRLSFGGTEFGPLKLHVADYAQPAGTDMFIGYNFFAQHVVCIDFPGHRVLIRH